MGESGLVYGEEQDLALVFVDEVQMQRDDGAEIGGTARAGHSNRERLG